MEYQVTGAGVLIISILVLYVGDRVTRRVRFLEHNNIPPAVTGGVLCSVLVALLAGFNIVNVTFDMSLRDLCLLAFFSTIGLGAKLRMLKAGGVALAKLLAIAVVLLVLQNVTGVGLAWVGGAHPGYGLMGGSISLAGGHGTAIAWGADAERAGLEGAAEFGIACATFGLIAGGLIGGPVAGWLVRRYKLAPAESAEAPTVAAKPLPPAPHEAIHIHDILGTLLALAVCVSAGDAVNAFLFNRGIQLPGFLTAMLVGIVLTNLADVFGVQLHARTIETTGEISLQLFLSMSLMSMQLLALIGAAGGIFAIVLAQMLVITLLAVVVVFRVMGRDYGAAVISGGFLGLGLGATPVAIANMSAITDKYGPSPKAFLVVPLVGAFFIDLANALIIKFFIDLPMLQPAAA